MPKVSTIQTNFSAGEISPRCFGRVDVARYQNGAESLENCIVDIQGGANRRDGKRFIASTKTGAKRSILIPFVFSTTQSYMLEFGDLYMRVYAASGGQIMVGLSPFELVTPYSESMLAEIDFTQAADTMFLFHPDVRTQTLKRLASDNWAIQPAPFVVEPFDEVGARFNASLTLSASTVGTGRTVVASADSFLSSDVGRRITADGAGLATVTAYTDPTHITITIDEPFASTSLAANTWILQDTPQASLTPSNYRPVGAEISLTLNGAPIKMTGLAGSATTITIDTATPHGLVVGNGAVISGVSPEVFNGVFTVTAVPSATQFQYTLNDPYGFARSLGTVYKYADGHGWRSNDVGKFVEVNGGLVQITAVPNDTVAFATIKREMSAAVSAPADSWILEGSIWSQYDGYPRTGGFYEQRLITAGSKRFPQSIQGSRNGLYYDFTQGTDDDEGFNFSLPSTGQINPISKLVGATVLLPLTFGGEFTMHGGVEKPLTPTNVQIKGRSTYGCANVKPVRIGNEILFVQRGGRKVRALSYDSDTFAYKAPDLTVLADHITKSGIVAMAYQQETYAGISDDQGPSSLIWCVLGDGKLAVLTMDRDEGVIAWAPQVTAGAYESVATIPSPDGGDEVWVIVRRTIGGVTKRYVERFDNDLNMDSAITGNNPSGTDTWNGLTHLEGQTVWAKGDSVFLGEFVVNSGSITLPRAAYDVEIGLPYINQVKPLRPDIQTGEGTAQSAAMSTSKVLPLVRDTTGCKIDMGDGYPQDIAFRHFGDNNLDVPPEVVSGYVGAGTLGWQDSNSPITLIQDKPYSFHLLALVRVITFNNP